MKNGLKIFEEAEYKKFWLKKLNKSKLPYLHKNQKEKCEILAKKYIKN